MTRSYFLHFLYPGETIPEAGFRASTFEWAECRLWTDKKAGKRYDLRFGPEQLQWIREYAQREGVPIEEAHALAARLQVEADNRLEHFCERVRSERSIGRAQPLPSRMRCMYLFDPSLNITAYAAQMGIPLDRTLLKIAPLEGSRVHLTRLSQLRVVGRTDHEISVACALYWDGLAQPELDSEVLMEGPYEVLGIESRR